MTIDELKERLSEIDAELSEILAELDEPADEEQNEEDRANRLNELEARSNDLTEERKKIAAEIEKENAEIEAEKRAAAEIAKGAGKPFEVEENNEMTNAEIRNSNAYIDAFAKYVKTNDDSECRALLTENVSGSVPVPTFVGEIVAARLEDSKILSRVRKMYAGGNVEVGFELDAPAAGVHTEGGEEIAEEALQLGIVKMVPKTFKKWVSISDEALDSMSGEAYLRYIYDEVARGIVKAEENAVVAAILAAPQTATASKPAVAKTGEAAGAITDFVNARALLSSAASDLVIIVTPAAYAQYRGYQMGANYGVDPFDGCEVLFNDAATAPIIGDLSGVMANFPKGENIEFKYDDKTNMKKDLVDILGRQPAAIEVVGNKFFAKVSA